AHGDPGYVFDLGGREQLGRGDEAQPAQRHAVDAAQVAMVDDRDPEIVDRAAEAVERHGSLSVYADLTERSRSLSVVSMRVHVRFFASLREAAGRDTFELELPEGATPEDAWVRLVTELPALLPRRPSVSAAVNRRYAAFDDRLA